MAHHFISPGQVLPAKCGVHIPYDAFYCGREGFLTSEQMVELTTRDIERYAKDQPLKFRAAMFSGMSRWPKNQASIQ